MTWEFILDAFLVVLMIQAAFKASLMERRQAMLVAALLTMVWLLYNLAWVHPVAPAHLLKVVGIPVEHSDVWMVTDGIAGALILAFAAEYEWAVILWGLLFCQVVATYFSDALPLRILDALFYCQIATFLFLRGGGIARFRDSLSDTLTRARRFSRTRAQGGSR